MRWISNFTPGSVLLVSLALLVQGASAQAPVPVAPGEGPCREVFNSGDCARLLEPRQIAMSGKRVQRDGDQLQLRLKGGTYKKFEAISRGAESVAIYYLGILEPIGYYVLFVQYYERSAIGILNEVRGWSKIVSDIPIPSPDGRRLITPFSTMNDSSGLVVWIAEGDTLRQEWSTGSTLWNPHSVRWLSNRSFAFERNLFQVQGPVDTAEVDNKGHWSTRLADGP
jgi:hypothetical protein